MRDHHGSAISLVLLLCLLSSCVNSVETQGRHDETLMPGLRVLADGVEGGLPGIVESETKDESGNDLEGVDLSFDLSAIYSFEDLSLDQQYTALQDDHNWYVFDKGIYRLSKTDGTVTFLYPAEFEFMKCFYNRCLIDGWIYYVDANWDICRIKTTGQDHAVILNAKQFWVYDRQPIDHLFVVDNYLLFMMSYQLYRYDMNTEDVTSLGHEFRCYEIHGTKAYRSGRDFSITEVDVLAHENRILLQGYPNIDKLQSTNLYSNFTFVGDELYFCMRVPYGLYRYQPDETVLIVEGDSFNEYSLCADSGKLYYVDRCGDAYKLMQYDPSSEAITEVVECNDFRAKPRIIDGYYYYLDNNFEVQRVMIWLSQPQKEDK